jgi:CubicO group peptidase (beta-lactamase class C family)
MSHTALQESLQSEIDAVVSRNRDVFGAVLGVAKDGFNWAGAAGTAYADRTDAMQADTPIYLASITKVYVAAATMILEERGRLSLEDPVSRFLPASMLQGLHRYKGRDYSEQLRVVHLISHTSGLPDYFTEKPDGGQSVFDLIVSGGDAEWDLDRVVDLAKHGLSPKFPPEPPEQRQSGKKAYYSDTNYQLLGAVLEAAMQTPLHSLLEDLVIEPLGLSLTYLAGHGQPQTGPPATIYYKESPLQVEATMRSFGPDGGMVSTAEDSLEFLKHLMASELFEHPSTLQRMQNWRRIFYPFQYGLGLMRSKLPRIFSPFAATPELIGHSGSTSAFLFCSDLGRVFIAGTLNQVENQGRPYRLVLKIVKMMEAAP